MVRASGREASETFAFEAFAFDLAGAADGFRFFAGPSFGGFFVGAPKLHLPEDALALHFLFQRLEGLIDVVVADDDLHGALVSLAVADMKNGPGGEKVSSTSDPLREGLVGRNETSDLWRGTGSRRTAAWPC